MIMIKKLLAMFAIGGFASLAMAPLNFWPAAFFGLSTLYIMVTRVTSPVKAGAFTFAFFLGYFGFSLSWIGNALLVEDNPYWWVWPFAVSGLPLVLSLFPVSIITAYKKFFPHNGISNYVLFCISFALADYARGHFFTGFPWNLFGYTWIDILPIAQLAALSDIYLLNTVTIFWAVAPAFILGANISKRQKTIVCFVVVATFIAAYLYGHNRINVYVNTSVNSSNTQFIIVQPNIKQSEKWKLEKRTQNFMRMVEISQYNIENDIGADTTIIIWPETAISQDILNTQWSMHEIQKMLSGYPRNPILITGALRYVSGKFYNSIITLDKHGNIIDTYDKRHLVPFGEYIPLDSYVKLSPVVGFTGFKKGDKENARTIDVEKINIRYMALICYEAIFPNYVRFTTSKKPDFIVNVTNDGWYGKSFGPYQHLVQARFRAIESGIPVVRSANTGVSAIISPLGDIVSYLDLMEKNILIEKLPQAIDY